MKKHKNRITAGVLLIPAADMLLVSILFMVISGNLMLIPAVRVQLPDFAPSELVSEENPVVTLTPGGGIFLNGRRVSKEGLAMILELSARLSRRKDTETILIIRADEGVAFQNILEIIEIAGKAGIQNTALATRTKR